MATATITVRLTDADEVQAVVNAAAAVLQEAHDKGSVSRQSMPLVQLYCALGSLSARLNRLQIEARHEGE